MTKKTEDEQKSERFNMFMSPSEMEAIDEWAWKNRVRSKSEAVRRLCQIALFVDRELDSVSDAMLDLSSTMTDFDRETFMLWANIISPFYKGEKLDRAAVGKMVEEFLENVAKLGSGIDEASSTLVGLGEAIVGLAKAGDAEQGKALIDTISEKHRSRIAELRKIRDDMQENRRRLSAIDFSPDWKSGDADK